MFELYPIFRYRDIGYKQLLSSFIIEYQFYRSEVILGDTNKPSMLVFIYSGEVEITKTYVKDNKIEYYTLMTGDVFGNLNIFNTMNCKFSIKAVAINDVIVGILENTDENEQNYSELYNEKRFKILDSDILKE